MKNRHTARVLAVQALYEHTVKLRLNIRNSGSDDVQPVFPWLTENEQLAYDPGMLDYSVLLYYSVVEKKLDIDAVIKKYLRNWTFSRLSIIDLSILRLSIYSLLFQKDIPANVIINEAVILSQEFSGDRSYAFINGILESVKNESAAI